MKKNEYLDYIALHRKALKDYSNDKSIDQRAQESYSVTFDGVLQNKIYLHSSYVDIIDLIKESFGVDCFIPVNTLFTKAEFLAAGIPWQPDKEPGGNSIFLYKKNTESS